VGAKANFANTASAPQINGINGHAINAADNIVIYDDIEDCESCKL
jgi:hypothetical protein